MLTHQSIHMHAHIQEEPVESKALHHCAYVLWYGKAIIKVLLIRYFHGVVVYGVVCVCVFYERPLSVKVLRGVKGEAHFFCLRRHKSTLNVTETQRG